MRFTAKDSAIRESIAPLRANHNARITIDFKMDLLNCVLCCLLCLNASGDLDKCQNIMIAMKVHSLLHIY